MQRSSKGEGIKGDCRCSDGLKTRTNERPSFTRESSLETSTQVGAYSNFGEAE